MDRKQRVNPTVKDAGTLIGWLLEAARDGPVEERGVTAALAAISGLDVTAVMESRGPRELTKHEQQQLQELGTTTCHERRGVLYAGTVRAAAITAVLLPHRIPAAARQAIGVDSSGAALESGGVPLGRALAGLGVRREPLEVRFTPGRHDASGNEQVIWSAARLWLGGPIALVTERVYQEFLAAYPGPWAERLTARRAWSCANAA